MATFRDCYSCFWKWSCGKLIYMCGFSIHEAELLNSLVINICIGLFTLNLVTLTLRNLPGVARR